MARQSNQTLVPNKNLEPETSWNFDDNEPSATRRWLLPGLLISLLLHAFLLVEATRLPIQIFSNTYYDRIVPRTFRLERVEIDPKLLEPEKATPLVKRTATPAPVLLSEDKITFEEVTNDVPVSTTAPKITSSLLKSDAPQAQIPQTTQRALSNTQTDHTEGPSFLSQELLAEKPDAATQPSILFENLAASLNPGSDTQTNAASSTTTNQKKGFSDLDALLAKTGPLQPETAPILMPADLLFPYNDASLQEAAITSLKKLGILIQRNPQLRFHIEGHTDAFGSEEFNKTLSEHRAESVKKWLIENMHVDTSQIETQGFGKSRLIAPATGTIEEQQINRRVEIVIRPRGN